jgi:hypothetical protein
VGSTFFLDGERGTDGGVHASGESYDGLDEIGHMVSFEGIAALGTKPKSIAG